MNKCIKVVGGNACNGSLIKYGKVKGRQRQKCKKCHATQMDIYLHNACQPGISQQIISHIKEGCGIRSIARLLNIASGTVIARIKRISCSVQKPPIESCRIYEMDELRTYVKNKQQECWIIYALDRQSGKIADFTIGRRTKDNIRQVTDALLLANCKSIFTDRLNIYRYLIPLIKHAVKRW